MISVASFARRSGSSQTATSAQTSSHRLFVSGSRKVSTSCQKYSTDEVIFQRQNEGECRVGWLVWKTRPVGNAGYPGVGLVSNLRRNTECTV